MRVRRLRRSRRWHRPLAVLDACRLRMSRFSVRGSELGRWCRARSSPDRAAQRVVGGGEVVAAAVPGADGLAGHVVEHPARAGFHAELVDAVAQHVVGVAHDDAAERVARLLDRRRDTARWLPSMSSSTRVAKLSSVPSRSWPGQTTRLRATVRNGRPSASKWTVVGVSAWAAPAWRQLLLVRTQRAVDALRIPGLPGVAGWAGP